MLCVCSSDAVFDSSDAADGMSGFDWLNQQKKALKEPFTSKLESSQILRRVKGPEESIGAFGGMKRIGDRLLDTTFVNSHRQYGVGVVGAWLGRAYRKSRMDSHIIRQMAVLDGHRFCILNVFPRFSSVFTAIESSFTAHADRLGHTVIECYVDVMPMICTACGGSNVLISKHSICTRTLVRSRCDFISSRCCLHFGFILVSVENY